MRIKIITEQKTYIVKRGDNLSKIAKELGLQWRDIARINNIQGPKYIIQPGQELKLTTGTTGDEKQVTPSHHTKRRKEPLPPTWPLMVWANIMSKYVASTIGDVFVAKDFHGSPMYTTTLDSGKVNHSIEELIFNYIHSRVQKEEKSAAMMGNLKINMRQRTIESLHKNPTFGMKTEKQQESFNRALAALGMLNNAGFKKIHHAMSDIITSLLTGEDDSRKIKEELGTGFKFSYQQLFQLCASAMSSSGSRALAIGRQQREKAIAAAAKSKADAAATAAKAAAEKDKAMAAQGQGQDVIPESRKIFENYFKKNNKNKITEQEENSREEITSMVTDAVNDILNALPDEDPAKNRETGLKLMAAIKQELQNPQRLASVVNDIADELGSELT